MSENKISLENAAELILRIDHLNEGFHEFTSGEFESVEKVLVQMRNKFEHIIAKEYIEQARKAREGNVKKNDENEIPEGKVALVSLRVKDKPVEMYRFNSNRKPEDGELVPVQLNGRKGGVHIAKIIETIIVEETEKEKAYPSVSPINDKEPTLLFIKSDEGSVVRNRPKLYPDMQEGDMVSYADEEGKKHTGEIFYVGKGELKEGYFFSLVEPVDDKSKK